MRILLQNNPATFYPDPIWNDGALGFFEQHRHPNEKNKMSGMRFKLFERDKLRAKLLTSLNRLRLVLSVCAKNASGWILVRQESNVFG